MHLKMMLVDAALKEHVAAIGDCRGAFYQSLLNPDGTESKVWIEPPPEAELGPNYIWDSVSIPRSQGSTESWGYIQRKRSHELHAAGTVGRHIDDFLVTGPESNVERLHRRKTS